MARMSDPETPEKSPATSKPGKKEDSFTSSHTSNFPTLLQRLGISLLVSTYQAGKLIILRPQGDVLNTHFCQFMSPMGVAYQLGTGRLAIGTRHEVWQFRNQRE